MPDAGRVIAGTAAGRRLAAAGPATRPLADRVKQTLFAILEPNLPGARFLDLFAGSGAAGIEALSRGAASAVFVEWDAKAVTAIRANLERTGFPRRAGTTVVAADALAWLRGAGRSVGPFDVVVIDPPYAEIALLRDTLRLLGDPAAGLITNTARVVAKHFWRDEPPPEIGLLASDRAKRFGETTLTFYRATRGTS